MRSIKKLFKFCFYIFLLIAIIIAVGVYYPAAKLPDPGFKGLMMVTDVNLVDIKTGEIFPNQNVLIDDGKVVNFSSDNIRPKDKLTIIIEGSNKYLIPALWDMNSQSSKTSPYFDHPLYIAHGVTHLRNLSGCLNKEDNFWACSAEREKWTRQAKDGNIISPIYHHNSTHPIADGSELPDSFPEYLKADHFDKAIAIINFAKTQNADFVTIKEALNRKVYFGLASEAAKSNIDVAGEIPHDASLPDVMSAGQKSIDSASIFAYECYSNARQLRNAASSKFDRVVVDDIINNQDSEKCQTLMTAMAASDTWWTPSLSVLEAQASRVRRTNPSDPMVKQFFFDKFFTAKTENKNITAYENLLDLSRVQVKTAWDLGVKILAGSNAQVTNSIPGLSLHNELENMVDGGLTPLQALQTASLNAAIFSEEIGNYASITIGANADFLLLSANPLNNISNTKKIEAVITNKRYLDKEALAELSAYADKQSKNWHQNIKYCWSSLSSPLKRHSLLNDEQSEDDSK